MAGLPSAPADWNHEQAHVLRSPFPALELVKIEAVGQHYQVFQSRKQNSRTFSEQERYEQATGPVTAEDELLSDDEEESADLLDLDPKDWKNQDHYAVLGLSKLRYKAKEDDIKKAFRKKVLKHHPDKKAQSGGSVDDDDFFKCVQKAFEILTDPVQRLHFDSVDPEFDDSIPSEKEVNLKNFYKVLGPVFKRNSRFSKKQPVPLLGDENSSPKEVDHFYNFWYNFDSWRVFNYLDEEDSMSRESREDKRYIERKNLKARAERKKEDNARIRQLTDVALKYDVRLKKFKDLDKEKKEAAKKAQEEAKLLQEEAAKKAQEEAKLKKQKEEEIQKAKAEEEKKEKEAKKNNLRKFRKNIRQLVKDCNYYLPSTVSAESQEVINGMIQLDKLCDDSTYEELSKLNDLSMKDPAAFHEVYQTELRRFFDEKELPPKIESSKLVSEVKALERPWTSEEVAFLIQAVNLFPGGTTQRWEKIAAHVNEHSKTAPRTVKDVTQEAGKIKQSLETGKVPEIETTKIVKKHNDTLIKDAPTQRFDEGPSQPAKPEPKGKGKEGAKPEAKPAAGKQAAKQPEAKPAAAAKQPEAKPAAAAKQPEAKPAAAAKQAEPKPAAAAAPKPAEAKPAEAKPAEGERAEEEDDKEEGGKPWSKEEQQALETALRNFPASVEGRWEKIAAAVGTRSKKDCMQRCKKLAQKIKEKKGN